MTAPLHLSKQHNTYQVSTLKSMNHSFLDAIDENNFIKMEQLMSQMLDKDLSEMSICKFHNYASVKHKTEVCQYLKYILLTHNNICIFN